MTVMTVMTVMTTISVAEAEPVGLLNREDPSRWMLCNVRVGS
jgi:hypothetical protein